MHRRPSCSPRSTRRCRRRVAAYRGGYLPEERRALEAALRRGDLIGLAATNALELGIDISGLDAVLMAGFPGTRAALWQQVGRAGRGAQRRARRAGRPRRPARHLPRPPPRGAVGAPVEATVFDPDNPYVLGPHLCAAAQELPLTEADLPTVRPDRARRRRRAHRRPGCCGGGPRGWFWTDRRRAADLADIRSTGGPPVAAGRGRHRPGARHRRRRPRARHRPRRRGLRAPGRDLAGRVARPRRARRGDRARRPRLLHLGARDHRHRDRRGARPPPLGRLPAVLRRRRGHPPGRVVPQAPPARRRGARRGAARPARAHAAHQRRSGGPCPTDVARRRPGWPTRDLPGAAHAAEHCSIGLLPLFATCDRWDIGGVSTALHPDTGRLTVFVYDGHPGGAGLRRARLRRGRAAWLTRDPRRDRRLRVRRGLPVVRPVAQVRQPEQPARQGRRGRAARRPARP